MNKILRKNKIGITKGAKIIETAQAITYAIPVATYLTFSNYYASDLSLEYNKNTLIPKSLSKKFSEKHIQNNAMKISKKPIYSFDPE